MGKGNQFKEYTYGVGLEITAQSFKQVKDDLKLNLDNLSKMVKSYGKVLKIDPDADLSKLFDGMRQLKEIMDGIDSSGNSFAGFVDKGTLGAMAALETRLSDIDSTSDRVNSQLTELKDVISQLIAPLKEAGAVKLPATFENLFGNFEDQASQIKAVSDSIAILRNSLTELKRTSTSVTNIYGDMASKYDSVDVKHVQDLINKFYDVRNKLDNIGNMDSSQAKDAIAQLNDIGIQLANAIKGLSENQLASLKIDDSIVVSELDDLINDIETRKSKLATELTELQNLQSKFIESQKVKTPSKTASIGLQSDVTAQVKVTPKTNDVEWKNTINDTIRNIEPNLHKVHLTPTFSKSKDIDKEIEGNLAQINHAVKVDLKVDHNVEKFNEQIDRIDTSIKNAKARLEKNGNFKIKFEYEEGGNFKGVAYEIINKLKQVEVHVDAKSTKEFLKELSAVKDAANKSLKNIKATVKFNSFDKLIKAVDTLKAGIDEKIKNVDIKLQISNEPQIIAQATMIRDKLLDLYENIPITMGVTTVDPNSTTSTPNGAAEQLSDAANAAKQDLERCRQILNSLQHNGFNAPEFLKLGDITPDGKKIKDSEEKLSQLLSKYKELKAKLPVDLADRWQELYPEANGDMKAAIEMANKAKKELNKIEAELNAYLQKQIAYTQNRYDQNKKILEQEKEIATVQNEKPNTSTEDNTSPKANEELALSAEEASKKVRSLAATLTHQKKVLEDLDKQGINSKSFLKVGEWDKETNSFKKFSNETLQLISRYKELKKAREDSGGTKVVGEEAKLRGQLAAILREQKKHAREILESNQKELEYARETVATYKGVGKKSSRSSSDKQTDVDTLKRQVEQLTTNLNKARAALSSLQSEGIRAVGSTGLKDAEGILKNAGIDKSLKEVVSLYDELLAKKKEFEASGKVSQSETKLASEIEALTKAKQLLDKKGFLGLTDTKIGDVKGRLGDDPQALDTLLSQYRQLLSAKKEFEKSGDTTSDSYIQTSQALEGATQQLKILYQDQQNEIESRIQGLQTEVAQRSEYIRITQECQKIEGLLVEVHKNQVDYARSKVTLYDEQLTKAQELLQVEQQRAQLQPNENKNPDANTGSSNTTPTGASAQSDSQEPAGTSQTSGVVKLDASTLSSLAKDATLTSINEKIGQILTQLGTGLNISGSNISIQASNVNVTGGSSSGGTNVSNKDNKTTSNENNPVLNQINNNNQLATSAENAKNKQAELKAEIKDTQEETKYMLSSTVSLVREVNDEIASTSDTYRTADKVESKTENWEWVNHGKEEPSTFEHTSTVYKTNLDAYYKLYDNFIKALAKQKQIEQQIANTDGPTAKLQAELEIQKEITKNLETQLKSHSTLYTQEAQRAAIAEATKKAQQELDKNAGAQSDKNINKQNADLMKIVDNANKKYKDMQYTFDNFKLPMSDSAVAKLKEYEQLLTELKLKQKEINENPSLLKDEDYSKNFDSLIKKMQDVESKFIDLQKSSENFLRKIRSVSDIQRLGVDFDPNNLEQMHSAMREFANQAGFGAAKLIEFNDAERTATFEIKNGKGQISQLTVEYDSATNSLGRYTAKTKEAESDTKKFLNSLKHSFGNVARYLASFGSVYRLFAMIKQGIQYVKEIDSALTELKKVTNATDAEYNKFIKTMSKTASVVGSTIKDLTTMSAEWARLGYSMEEAGKLAQSTAVLLNVSEFTDATKASEALISTMQAFQYTADQSMHVVDVLNEVGELLPVDNYNG